MKIQHKKVLYLVKQGIQQGHVLRLGLDRMREKHVGLVWYQIINGRLLHTWEGEREREKQCMLVCLNIIHKHSVGVCGCDEGVEGVHVPAY